MTDEQITLPVALQRLSEANGSNTSRLTDLETKLTEMYNKIMQKKPETTSEANDDTSDFQNTMTNRIQSIQAEGQRWQDQTKTQLEQNKEEVHHVTKELREMREEVKKICEVIMASHIVEKNNTETVGRQESIIPNNNRTSEGIEQQTAGQSPRGSRVQEGHREESEYNETMRSRWMAQPTQNIVIPPLASIPTFSGNITESPRQFLIQIKEYTETVNHWDDELLLRGISQYLRDTAFEWYCQLRTAYRRPHDWLEFTVLFLAQFNSPIRRARQKEEWKNCKQEKNETMNQFIVRLRAVWREQKPHENEEHLAKHLIRKMRNDVLYMMGLSRCETVEEITIEAQKIEQVMLDRSNEKYSQTQRSEENQGHFLSTSTSGYENQFEVQAMSAHQNNGRGGAYTRRNEDTTNRYTNYGQTTTGNQAGGKSAYDIQCYACGKRGHIAAYCRSQQNRYQQQYSREYQKNGHGAQGGRN